MIAYVIRLQSYGGSLLGVPLTYFRLNYKSSGAALEAATTTDGIAEEIFQADL